MQAAQRKWYWSFLQAYAVCYVSLVGLFIVIDAYSNVDEFAKRADGIIEMSRVMGRYYLYDLKLYSTSLCGVVAAMAAIPTLVAARHRNRGS